MIYSFYIKKAQFRSFEECVSVVSDPLSNWITRKGTLKYCIEESNL
jgi:hypothetical protein